MIKCPMIRAKCPESTDCPCWTELVMSNVATGEEKIEKDCLFRLMPKLMVEVIRASNRPAQELGQIRNHMVDGFAKLPDVMASAMVNRVNSLEHKQ